MSGISQIEIWLYIGVALMILAVITGIFSALIYSVTGRKLRRTLEKADKRSLSAKEETLRREVDMLKNLSQSYIPQVYDFVQENGVVYTVMDYIEGESLDKLLARGQKIEQAEVIRWACQLLEALSYLHQVPPHGFQYCPCIGRRRCGQGRIQQRICFPGALWNQLWFKASLFRTDRGG